MPRIKRLNIKGVRCFGAEQSARISRITLLVGKNDVGKSTFLACYNAFASLCNLNKSAEDNPFDVKPFHLGEYDGIARYPDSGFSLAGEFSDHMHHAAEFSFGRGKRDFPLENHVKLHYSNSHSSTSCVEFSTKNSNTDKRMRVAGPNFDFSLRLADISFLSISDWLSRNVRSGHLPYDGNPKAFEQRLGGAATPEHVEQFVKFTNFFRSEMPLPVKQSFNVCALSPELPRRKRSYISPPAHLDDTENRRRIDKIGETLKLWRKVDIASSPVDGSAEVSVTTETGTNNLLDVGYGIHALLPLVSNIGGSGDRKKVFLLQQPEIHVHPSAQAELAEFLVRTEHEYIIETHSDHIVDRMRLCVLNGALDPEELCILFLEKDATTSQTNIFSISVDEQANLLDVPDSYRRFFLEETERLLGIR